MMYWGQGVAHRIPLEETLQIELYRSYLVCSSAIQVQKTRQDGLCEQRSPDF